MRAGEDGTSHQKRIDLVVDQAAKIMGYGLNGGPHRFETLEQLRAAVLEHGLASTFYVVMIIPQKAGAPAIPLIIDSNDNSFTTEDVEALTRCILRHVASKGLGGRIILDVADGDSRLRNQAFNLHDHPDSPARDYFTVDHPFVTLRLPYFSGHGFFTMIILNLG